MDRFSLLILLVIMGSVWATNRKDKRANSCKNKVKGTDKSFGLALPVLFAVIFIINVYLNLAHPFVVSVEKNIRYNTIMRPW